MGGGGGGRKRKRLAGKKGLTGAVKSTLIERVFSVRTGAI